MAAKQKMTVYVSEETYNDIKRESERQDRSISWIIEHCWKLAESRVTSYPGIEDFYQGDLDAMA